MTDSSTKSPAVLEAPRDAPTKSLPVIKNSQLRGVEMRRTAFVSCNLVNMDLRGCNLSCSTLINCKLLQCNVSACDLRASTLHDTKITASSLDNCKVTSSPLDFRKFCPELRLLIFELCVDFWKHKKTPKLLVALRGDPELYHEALGCYYRLNTFRLNQENFTRCEEMSQTAINNIRRLSLSLHRTNRLVPGLFPSSFIDLSMLSYVNMSVVSQDEVILWVKFLVQKVPNLRGLRVSIPVDYYRVVVPSLNRLRVGMDDLGRYLGMVGQINRVTTSYWEPWNFEVPEGQTLKWRDLE